MSTDNSSIITIADDRKIGNKNLLNMSSWLLGYVLGFDYGSILHKTYTGLQRVLTDIETHTLDPFQVEAV